MTETRNAGLLAAAGLFLAGCGWSTGLGLPEEAGDVETIGVAIFDRSPSVLERGLEQRMNQSLSRVVVDLVGAPLASPDEADLVLRGRILEYRRRGGIRSSDNELLETGVKITVLAELVARSTGEPVRPPIQRSVWSGYTIGDPENEDDARDRALRYLSETIVLDLFRPDRAEEASATDTGVETAASDAP